MTLEPFEKAFEDDDNFGDPTVPDEVCAAASRMVATIEVAMFMTDTPIESVLEAVTNLIKEDREQFEVLVKHFWEHNDYAPQLVDSTVYADYVFRGIDPYPDEPEAE